MTENKDENLEFQRQAVSLDYAQLGAMILKDLNSTASSSTIMKTYTRDNVKTYLANPSRYSKELVDLSRTLYNYSPHYKRLVNYFAHMATLDYIVEPYALNVEKINEKTFRTGYQRTLDLLDLMNVKHEMKKAQTTAWLEDTFYGYEHVAKDSYFIQKLPSEFCQISSIEDGVYNFSFNMQYFDRNPLQLEYYPPEFKKLYNAFKAGKGQWQELDPKYTICLKVNEELDYDLPPLAGVFASIFDIEDYKSLRKTSETIGNYKFIVQKIPMREKSDRNNDFLIDMKNVAMFHNKTSSTLPDEVGLITSPFEVEKIDFARTNKESDSVSSAERELYTGAGTPQALFNGEGSQNNLSKAIQVVENEVFSFIRQIERWVNRKLRNEVKGAYKFRARFLDITTFNRKETFEQLLQAGQYGLPVKMMIGASLGLSPSSLVNLAVLENNILGLADMFIPLSSAHTQTGDATDEGGRPEKSEDELSEKGVEQKERGDNQNRA